MFAHKLTFYTGAGDNRVFEFCGLPKMAPAKNLSVTIYAHDTLNKVQLNAL